MNRSLLKSYALLTPALLAVFAGLYLVVERAAAGRVDPFALLAPLIALVGLTGVVWLLMFVVRNLAVVRGAATVRYYQAYSESEAPLEWIERPARAFMNLLELPVLFYVLCLLMLVTTKNRPVAHRRHETAHCRHQECVLAPSRCAAPPVR